MSSIRTLHTLEKGKESRDNVERMFQSLYEILFAVSLACLKAGLPDTVKKESLDDRSAHKVLSLFP